MKWSDDNLTSAVGSGNFFKFQPGNNTIRIVSETEVLAKHYIDKKYSVCVGKEQGCEGCKNNDKPQVKWLCWIIDRADNSIKKAELGFTVVKAIGALSQSAEYSFEGLPPYDITVNKSGEGLDTEYTVMASRKDTELTEDEKEEIMGLEHPIEIVLKMKNKKPDEHIPDNVEYDATEEHTEEGPF